jgi:phytoene synthase
VTALYAAFRRLDDLVDECEPDAAERLTAVERWAAGHETAQTPELALLRSIDARRPLPRAPFYDFCAGMRDDLHATRFRTERELDRYCYRVAGTVGLVMLELLGTDHPQEARGAAISLGIAMQLTNILRDIDEDAARGRIYITDEARARYGWSLAPGERQALLHAQIARTDEFYEDGLLGLSALRAGRPAIAMAAGLYREILREIERTGLGRQPGRAVVSAP